MEKELKHDQYHKEPPGQHTDLPKVVLDVSGIEWNVYGTGTQANAIHIGDCLGAMVEYSDTGNSFQNPAERKAHLPRFVSVEPARCTSAQSRK